MLGRKNVERSRRRLIFVILNPFPLCSHLGPVASGRGGRWVISLLSCAFLGMFWCRAQGFRRRSLSKDGPQLQALLDGNPEAPQESSPRGFYGVLRDNVFLSALLLFIPLGFGAKWQGCSDSTVFAFNFLGIVPMAWLIGKSTEDLSAVTGEVLGGLLNATFGNIVEMLLCIASIRSGQLTITKCTLLGSMLSNLLLVMGCSCLFGGIFGLHLQDSAPTQHFTESGANVQIVMLLLAILCIGMPTAYADTMEDVDDDSSEAVLAMSRKLSVLLLVAYFMYLYFQIVSHSDLFGDTEDEGDADMTPCFAAGVLAVCTCLCAASTELLIGSISGTIESWGWSKEFVGVILLPIIGNAAEHYTAISVALMDKMDLAIGVAIGSSCQMALLVAPFTVLIGWTFDRDMNLDFHSFQLFILIGSVLVVASVLWSRQVHWLYGAMMVIAYLAVAVVYLNETPQVSVFHDRPTHPAS